LCLFAAVLLHTSNKHDLAENSFEGFQGLGETHQSNSPTHHQVAQVKNNDLSSQSISSWLKLAIVCMESMRGKEKKPKATSSSNSI